MRSQRSRWCASGSRYDHRFRTESGGYGYFKLRVQTEKLSELLERLGSSIIVLVVGICRTDCSACQRRRSVERPADVASLRRNRLELGTRAWESSLIREQRSRVQMFGPHKDRYPRRPLKTSITRPAYSAAVVPPPNKYSDLLLSA
jgi:hypothetical protein